MPKKTIPLNIMLSSDEKEMLTELSALQGWSMAFTLRHLLKSAYNMTYKKMPMCANGTACLFPGAHKAEPQAHPPV